MAIITFLGGIQLLSIGIVGEYVGKTYVETKQRPIYLTEEVIESRQANSKSGNISKGHYRHAKTS